MIRRRKRRRSTVGSRCNFCDTRVQWFRDAVTGKPRKFELRLVDGRTHTGRPACPIENGRTAWRLRDLVEDLMVRRQCSETEAREEAYDMPWFVAHTCAEGDRAVSEGDSCSG